jgi:hypothetical protein
MVSWVPRTAAGLGGLITADGAMAIVGAICHRDRVNLLATLREFAESSATAVLYVVLVRAYGQ